MAGTILVCVPEDREWSDDAERALGLVLGSVVFIHGPADQQAAIVTALLRHQVTPPTTSTESPSNQALCLDRQCHGACGGVFPAHLDTESPSDHAGLDGDTPLTPENSGYEIPCVAADTPADDGYCGAPEFCDCARYALQRQDAQARAPEAPASPPELRSQAWCLDRPSGTVVFIGSRAAAERAALPMTVGGMTKLMINGPYELQFEQDPLSRGAEPGHDMGPGPGYTPEWMRVLKLRPGPGGSQSGYKVIYADNGVFVGDILCKEDGFYDFWPADREGGYWSAHVLRAIADCVDELNEPWQTQIDNDPRLSPGGTD